MTAPVELVHVVRNGLVESVHMGDVAVCDADGTLRAARRRSRASPVRSLLREAAAGGGLVLGDGRAGSPGRRGRRDVRLPLRRSRPCGGRAAPAAAGTRSGRRPQDPARPRHQGRPSTDLGRLLGEPRRAAGRRRAPGVGSRHLPSRRVIRSSDACCGPSRPRRTSSARSSAWTGAGSPSTACRSGRWRRCSPGSPLRSGWGGSRRRRTGSCAACSPPRTWWAARGAWTPT